MSNLVILEGFLNHIVKHKAIVEVYAVLTPASLKIYRTQIAYRGNPDAPIKTVDFSNDYVLLPSFEKTRIFTLFRKGEKAFERLYLEASSKENYDMWLKEIDVQMNVGAKMKENCSVPVDDCMVPKETTPETQSVEDFDDMKKVVKREFVVKSGGAVKEKEQLQQSLDKIQMDLRKERMNVAREIQEKDQLRLKVLESESTVARVENESRENVKQINDLLNKITFLEKSLQENFEFSSKQLEKIGQDIGTSMNPIEIDLTTFQSLIDYLLSTKMHKSFLDSFLRQQLEHLIHKSPISPSKDLSLFKYLTTSIEMSSDSIVIFVSNFLLTLMSHSSLSTSSSSHIGEGIAQVVRSVVETPPSKSSSNKSFQQTAIEVAYLLRKRGPDQKVLSNGYSKPRDIHIEFTDLLTSLGLERVNEVLILELTNHITEKCRAQASIETVEKKDVTKNVITEHFANVWDNLLSQLNEIQLENDDLRITLREVSAKNQELEAACSKTQYSRNVDKIINCYTSVSKKLCPSCQIGVSELLQTPLTTMVNDFVDNFRSYWKSLNDLNVFLAKKKTNNRDIRDAHEMMVKSQHKFEMMVPQLQEITQRSISSPEDRE